MNSKNIFCLVHRNKAHNCYFDRINYFIFSSKPTGLEQNHEIIIGIVLIQYFIKNIGCMISGREFNEEYISAQIQDVTKFLNLVKDNIIFNHSKQKISPFLNIFVQYKGLKLLIKLVNTLTQIINRKIVYPISLHFKDVIISLLKLIYQIIADVLGLETGHQFLCNFLYENEFIKNTIETVICFDILDKHIKLSLEEILISRDQVFPIENLENFHKEISQMNNQKFSSFFNILALLIHENININNPSQGKNQGNQNQGKQNHFKLPPILKAITRNQAIVINTPSLYEKMNMIIIDSMKQLNDLKEMAQFFLSFTGKERKQWLYLPYDSSPDRIEDIQFKQDYKKIIDIMSDQYLCDLIFNHESYNVSINPYQSQNILKRQNRANKNNTIKGQLEIIPENSVDSKNTEINSKSESFHDNKMTEKTGKNIKREMGKINERIDTSDETDNQILTRDNIILFYKYFLVLSETHIIELLFVLSTLLAGKRKYDIQNSILRKGLIKELTKLFDVIIWKKYILSNNDSLPSQSSDWALKIQYLRFLHNFIAMDEFDLNCRMHFVLPEEIGFLLKYEIFPFLIYQYPNFQLNHQSNVINFIHEIPKISFSACKIPHAEEPIPDYNYFEANSDNSYSTSPLNCYGLLMKIIKAFIDYRSHINNDTRCWILTFIEAFLKGQSPFFQLLVARSGIIKSLLEEIFNNALSKSTTDKGKLSMQSAFDLISETIKFNKRTFLIFEQIELPKFNMPNFEEAKKNSNTDIEFHNQFINFSTRSGQLDIHDNENNNNDKQRNSNGINKKISYFLSRVMENLVDSNVFVRSVIVSSYYFNLIDKKNKRINNFTDKLLLSNTNKYLESSKSTITKIDSQRMKQEIYAHFNINENIKDNSNSITYFNKKNNSDSYSDSDKNAKKEFIKEGEIAKDVSFRKNIMKSEMSNQNHILEKHIKKDQNQYLNIRNVKNGTSEDFPQCREELSNVPFENDKEKEIEIEVEEIQKEEEEDKNSEYLIRETSKSSKTRISLSFDEHSQIMHFVRSHLTEITSKLIDSINIKNLNQSNISCLNTIVVIFIIIKLENIEVASSFLNDIQNYSGIHFYDQMLNLRELFSNWIDFYGYRNRDAMSLEFSTKIPFYVWKTVVSDILDLLTTCYLNLNLCRGQQINIMNTKTKHQKGENERLGTKNYGENNNSNFIGKEIIISEGSKNDSREDKKNINNHYQPC